MNTWEEIEQRPEFGVLTPEDRAAVHDEWRKGVLDSLAEDDPETVDAVGVNRFIATEKARNESFKTGRPFDPEDAVDMEPVRADARVKAQKQTLADLDELERAQFALKEASAARGITSGADRGMVQSPRVTAILDKPRTEAQAKLDELSSRFTPEQLQQAREAKQVLQGERPTAVLGSDLYTDPALVLDKDKYRAAVAASNASPEAKARAIADFSAKRQQVATEALKTFRIAGESPLPGALDFPSWEATQPEDVRKLSPEDKALRYMKTMEGRGDFRKLTSAIGTGLLQGGTDVASQGLGVAAMAVNSPALAKLASETAEGGNVLEETQKLEGDKKATGATTLGGAARLLPPMAAAIGAGAATGGVAALPVSAALSGAQTAGAQFPSTFKALVEQGMPEDKALEASRNAAITSGLITTAITAAFGKTGAEAALLTGAGGKELVKNRLVAALKATAKGAGAEIPEELLDEAATQVIEQRTIDPNKPVSQIVDEFAKTAPELAMQIALLGGAGGAIGSVRNTTTTPGATPVPGTTVEAPPDNDFARRAAMEGATEFRPNQGTPVQANGITIAHIPEGSPLTPEDVADFADDPDFLKALARKGDIVLPEVVAPLPGVDPAITEELNTNIAASAALAPQTVEALKATQAEGAARNAAVLQEAAARLAGTEKGPDLGFARQQAPAESSPIPAQEQVASQLGHEGNRKLWTDYLDKVKQWAQRNPEKARLIAENAQDVRVAVVGGTSDSARNHVARGDIDLVFDDNIADPDIRDAVSSLQTGTVGPVHQPMMANLDNNAAAGMADASDTRIDAKQAILDALTGQQVSPVTTETETPSNEANVAGGSQSVQTEPAGGSIPAVTGDTVSTTDIPSTGEIQPTDEATTPPAEPVEEKPDRGTAQAGPSRDTENPDSAERPEGQVADNVVALDPSQLETIPEDLARAKERQAANTPEWQRAAASTEPISVLQLPNGKYRVLDGHHRLLAAIERGEPVQAIVEKPVAPSEEVRDSTDHSASNDEVVEANLAAGDKQEAAIQLGFNAWGKDTLAAFNKAFADWMVTAKAGTEALGRIFARLLQALKKASMVALAGISVSNTNVSEATSISYDATTQAPAKQTSEKREEGRLPNDKYLMPVPEKRADFGGVRASKAVINTANWVVANGDAKGTPFVVADKRGGLMYVFDAQGTLVHKAPALYGKTVGDIVPEMQPDRPMWSETDKEKVTPSGRFEASMGVAIDEEKLGRTLDFLQGEDSDLAIHRLYLGNEADNRPARLSTRSASDNRISYGCINVSDSVMDSVIDPLFSPEGGVVYILPETSEGARHFPPFVSPANSTPKSDSVERPWSPATNEPATFTAANGQKVVGTVSNIAPDGKATVQFVWNGKPQTVVVPAARLSRPVASVAPVPNYEYTQEQNTRKAGKHFPVAPGVYEKFTFDRAFASMAEDTSLSRKYREVARILSKMPGFGNVDLHIVADGRKGYAGEYSHHKGKSAIAVNLRQVARGKVDALGTILHEALHHVTLAKVRNPQGAVETEAAQALDQIRQRVRAYAGVKEKSRQFSYELDTNEEFISALFTHPGFQDFLASIPDDFSPKTGASKFRSLLTEIFRRIAELVTGKHVAKGSTMEQSIASILALFETPHRTLDVGPLEKLSAKSLAGQSAQDAEYMAAVESGDVAKQQAMVDAAAKAAGYTVGPVWHHGGFNAAEDAVPQVGGEGMHFGTEDAARQRAYGKLVDDFIKEGEVTFDDDLGAWFWSSQGVDSYDVAGEEGFQNKGDAQDSLEQFASHEGEESGADASELGTFTKAYLKAGSAVKVADQKDSWHKAVAKAKAAGADAIEYKNLYEDKNSTSYIVFDPNQIKSADPITRDAEGNVIPLSQRFNPESNSTLYSKAESTPNVQTAVMFDGKPLVAANGVTHYDLLKNWIKKNLLQPYQRENADEANALADKLLTNDFLREHGVKEGFMVDGEFKDRQQALQALRDAGQPVPQATAEGRDWLDSSDLATTPKSEAEDQPVPDPFTARTRARFVPWKEEDQFSPIVSNKATDKKAVDWINAVGPVQAANLLLSDRTPGWMDLATKNYVVGRLMEGFVRTSLDPEATEDEKTVADATNQRLNLQWKRQGKQAGMDLQSRAGVNNTILQPIAPVLAAKEVLAEKGRKILEKQFDGGEEGAATRTAEAKDKADAEADERLENIISRLMGSMSPKQTAVGALAKMFRGKGQRDQIVDEVAKALMLKARGNVVTPERKTALANLVSSLKSTLAASVKGEKKPAPERTMQDLLTSAFVNQVSEGATFADAWKEGRQKVLDMLIDMELDKTYHPAEARLKDLRAKLAHLEAGNAEQQKASAAERAQLADQISSTKAEMKSAMEAVKAMTPALETQRDGLMPSAPTVAFDPASAKEAIGRAFEQAGYTAELDTGLDKSGKRALSIKDALLNRKRATDAVMKQFDEAMAAKDVDTQRDWPQARAFAEKAVKETLDAWQVQMDEAKAAKLEATKQNLLSEDSKALEKLVKSIRAKIAPDADWSDILQDLPRTQAERLAAIKERVAKHEALKDLTPDEATKLAENVDKLWQRERLKAFQDELLKAGVLKAKNVKAAVNVASVAPELIRLMNLGVFNSSTFREAVSKRFGIKQMSNAQADALRKLAAAAWELPQGVLRNKRLKELVEGLQHVTGSSWSDTVSSYWAASVLSGLNTQFNTWLAVLNGLSTNLIQAGGQLVRGHGAAAIGAQRQWWRALGQGMSEAGHILWTGDTSFTKRFESDIIDALNGEKGVHPIAIGEKMWKNGTVMQKIPGALMMMVGRSMVAADHVNNTATTQGAMAVARAMNPELYEGKTSWTQAEINAARAQALQETTAGEEPTTREERTTVSARTREILNSGVKEEDRAEASNVGDIAAFQNEPTGVFGGLYRGVKNMLSSWTRGLDEKAQDEEANRITRAICAVGAGSVYAATGTRFMRYGFNIGNEYIRYMPGSWALNKVAPILGSNLSPMQQEMLLGKNLVGAMILGTLYTMFGGDDEEKEGQWQLEGPWDTLSAEEKASRRSAGLAPNTMWVRKDGKIQRISYGQWAAAGVIGAAGSMLDEKRYNPEEWKKRGPAGHMLRGAVTGLFQVQNVSALENLAKILGGSPSNQQDKVNGPVDRLAEMGTAYAGGFAPTFLKDLDKWDDPRNFKAEGAWEKLIREMPVARRYVQDGRAQFNRLGEDVRVHREPYSRLYTADEVSKAQSAYANLISRGVDFPNPSTDRKIFKDGKKVPMDSLGKQVAYDFEKSVALAYGKYLAEHGEELKKLPTQAADKVVQRKASLIIDIEARKVQAKVNNP